ncbi:MAG TPA: hypothetical protein VE465_04700, partial [Streptosporangiaceae bacterium]|nr:hypothetical protein [Streptosporangiaceae bacterium]
WGRWRGTAEETAYAVQTLLHTRSGSGAGTGAGTGDPVVARAAARGCGFLIRLLRRDGSDVPSGPPLFHGKDLFALPGLTRAAVLAALESAGRRPEVVEIDVR